MGSAPIGKFVLGMVFTISGTVALAQQQRNTWREFRGGLDSSHYSPLVHINGSNVDRIVVPLDVAYPGRFAQRSPAPERATMSFGRGGGGGERGAHYRQSNYRSDPRILLSANSFRQAIDARRGQLIDWFRTGIDRTLRPLSTRTPGGVFENLVILGSATGEGCLAPPGDLLAFDIVTGKLVWVFHTIPRPGELGHDTWPKDAYQYMGVLDTWCEFTAHETRGIVYFPAASLKYELYGADRPGNNLSGDCLISDDARTGKYLWHYQPVHHDIWDYGIPSKNTRIALCETAATLAA